MIIKSNFSLCRGLNSFAKKKKESSTKLFPITPKMMMYSQSTFISNQGVTAEEF